MARDHCHAARDSRGKTSKVQGGRKRRRRGRARGVEGRERNECLVSLFFYSRTFLSCSLSLVSLRRGGVSLSPIFFSSKSFRRAALTHSLSLSLGRSIEWKKTPHSHPTPLSDAPPAHAFPFTRETFSLSSLCRHARRRVSFKGQRKKSAPFSFRTRQAVPSMVFFFASPPSSFSLSFASLAPPHLFSSSSRARTLTPGKRRPCSLPAPERAFESDEQRAPHAHPKRLRRARSFFLRKQFRFLSLSPQPAAAAASSRTAAAALASGSAAAGGGPAGRLPGLSPGPGDRGSAGRRGRGRGAAATAAGRRRRR